MSRIHLPSTGHRLEISMRDSAHACRVEAVDGTAVSVAAPPLQPDTGRPEPGALLDVRWTDPRGRHHVRVRLEAVHPEPHGTWDLRVMEAVGVAQERAYVRGGGGEPMRLRPLDPPTGPIGAEVVDVAERGVRGRFRSVGVAPGDPTTVEFVLDGEVIHVLGRVLRVITQPELRAVDVVVVFEPTEQQARHIRRYVLAGQLRARRLAS
ncbi:MAG TPA: hypothetical protein VFY17_07970 [Pilimelia sp.]|nr:hypothetical protein [Pilimelia sp.]